MYGQRVITPHHSRPSTFGLFLCRHPAAAAGTPAGASARQWLKEQGVFVMCICVLAVDDADAERLFTLLISLPALTSICGLTLRALPGAAVAATQDSLAAAACAIGQCSCLRRLDLRIELADELADRVPATFWQFLAEARALEDLNLTIRSGAAETADGSATANRPHLVTGLAGLSGLRTLALSLDNVREDATLPACLSRLVQLTSLTLMGLRGLRCAPGWARLPALQRLQFEECAFAADGEDALPGMDALGALTCFELFMCSGLDVLPASLWQLTGLRQLGHWRILDEPPDEYLPASAPCFAFLTDCSLTGHELEVWPACVLAMTCLTALDLNNSCFEEVPEGVSVLTALEALTLGRHSEDLWAIGGTLDARALGNLARFPYLRSLTFIRCSVLLCPSFQAAAAHPCLRNLALVTSYPAPGPSCAAFLGFVAALLQQGRAGVLRVRDSVVQGAGQHEDQNFRGALLAVGFPL